jgi:hypothetical protein
MSNHHPTILIADDPYTMAAVNLLLATDWRFQVVEKESSLDRWRNRTPRHTSSKSVLVLASDAIHSEGIQKICESQFIGKTLLLTGRRRLSLLRQIPPNLVNGILVKQEIGYCLGWALDYACQGFWVTTPSVQSVMPSLRRVVSDPVIVLAQPKHPYDLTPSPLDFRLNRIYKGDFVYDNDLWVLKSSILSTFSIISIQVAPRLHQGSSGKAAHIIIIKSHN